MGLKSLIDFTKDYSKQIPYKILMFISKIKTYACMYIIINIYMYIYSKQKFHFLNMIHSEYQK